MSILVTSGLVRRQDLYRLLGELWRAPYVDLTAERLDTSLLAGLDPDRLVRDGWIPVRALDDGRVLVAGMHPPDDPRVAGVSARLGQPVSYAVTTDWDLRYALQRSYRDLLLDRAASPVITAQVISAVCGLAFLVCVAFKFAVCMVGAGREQHEAVSDADVRSLRDEDLPVYTVLVPPFREANVIGDLIENLARLDYPHDKLDIR